MSLKTKMAVAVSALIAGVVSVAGFFVISFFHEKLDENISQQQYTLISTMATEIDDKLFTAQKALVAVAKILPVDTIADPERALMFLEDKAGIKSLFDHGLFIFSAEGKLVAETDFPPGRSGMDFSYRDYYRKTVASGKPVISDPYFSTRPHHPLSIMFTAPIFDTEGKMAGLLGGGLELMKDNFLGKASHTRIGKTGYIDVFNTERNVILHPDPQRMKIRNAPEGLNKLLDQAILGFEGSGETVNSEGIPMLTSCKRLTVTNWIVAGNYPLSELHEPIDRAQGSIAAVLVIFCALSMILARFLMKQLLTPLLAFTKHVAELSAKEGTERIFRNNALDEIGALTNTFNLMIGELDKRQDELRKFSLAVEQSPGTIVITDLTGTIEYVNAKFTELTGYTRAEAIGQNPRILKSGKTKPSEYEELWQTITSGREWQGEFRNRKKNGEFFWEHAKISPLTDASGVITHFMAIKEDITARKQSEQALQAERQRLFSVLENLPGFVCLITPDHSISFTNRYFRERFGEVDDRPCYQVIRGRQQPCVPCPAFQALAEKQPQVWEWEGRGNRTYQVHDYPFTDIDGSPLVLGLGIDISERKQAEQEVSRLNGELEQKVQERTSQLMEAQEELVRKEKLSILGQLCGSVGHELRNPLGVMSNAIYFLKMAHADGDEITREYLDLLKQEIGNSQRIISDLLDFARTKTPQTQVVSARELINQSLEKCSIPENIRLRIDLPAPLPLLEIDPLQMEQVFQNLITNAIQAMPGGGLTCIAAQAADTAGTGLCGAPVTGDRTGLSLPAPRDWIEISVADTGEGISPENMKNLFQPLFTTKSKGIGLGLVVCKNLTEANGGTIRVESRLGEGTTFRVFLPVKA